MKTFIDYSAPRRRWLWCVTDDNVEHVLAEGGAVTEQLAEKRAFGVKRVFEKEYGE